MIKNESWMSLFLRRVKSNRDRQDEQDKEKAITH
jgi:hypothetical protein